MARVPDLGVRLRCHGVVARTTGLWKWTLPDVAVRGLTAGLWKCTLRDAVFAELVTAGLWKCQLRDAVFAELVTAGLWKCTLRDAVSSVSSVSGVIVRDALSASHCGAVGLPSCIATRSQGSGAGVLR